MRRTGPLTTALTVWTLIALSFGWMAHYLIALMTGVSEYRSAIVIWLGGVLVIALLAEFRLLPFMFTGDRCPNCGYDCKAIPSRPNDARVCPECGGTID